jgi:hypothetical protein
MVVILVRDEPNYAGGPVEMTLQVASLLDAILLDLIQNEGWHYGKIN